MSMCFFYASIFPVGALISSIGLVISYFLGKKMLITHCSIPRISFKLGILIVIYYLNRLKYLLSFLSYTV